MLAGANNLRDVTRLLLEAGADVAMQDDTFGETALHWAAFAGDEEVITMLLDAGAQVDVKSTMNGQTPLFYAAHHGHVDIVKLLISRGADPHIKDKDGASVLKWSISPATEYLQELGVE
jgi:cytohesin